MKPLKSAVLGPFKGKKKILLGSNGHFIIPPPPHPSAPSYTLISTIKLPYIVLNALVTLLIIASISLFITESWISGRWTFLEEKRCKHFKALSTLSVMVHVWLQRHLGCSCKTYDDGLTGQAQAK